MVDEVIKLSKKYGIITEFTSFLVQEDTDISKPVPAYREEVNKKLDTAQDADKGSWAISQSRNASKLKNQANQAPNSYYNNEGKTVNLEQQVQNMGNKTFFNKKSQWVDSDFKEENIIKIKLYSQAYFEIIKKIKGLDKYLSVGNEISVNIKGQNVQIGKVGKEVLSASEKNKLGLQ